MWWVELVLTDRDLLRHAGLSLEEPRLRPAFNSVTVSKSFITPGLDLVICRTGTPCQKWWHRRVMLLRSCFVYFCLFSPLGRETVPFRLPQRFLFLIGEKAEAAPCCHLLCVLWKLNSMKAIMLDEPRNELAMERKEKEEEESPQTGKKTGASGSWEQSQPTMQGQRLLPVCALGDGCAEHRRTGASGLESPT